MAKRRCHLLCRSVCCLLCTMSNPRKVDVRRDGRTLEQSRIDTLNNLGARRRHLEYPHPWAGEIADWIDRSIRHVEEDMRRMEERMFPLLPLKGVGLDPWGAALHSLPAIAGSPSAMMGRMEENMRAMRREMDSAFGMANAGDGAQCLDWLSTHDCLTGCRAMDELKDNYQIGDDGQLHLSVNFNTKDFAPEDIHVTVSDNRLVVQAKKTVQTDNSRSTKQFYRRIDLPESVDQNSLQCRLSEDGVLSVDVPVRTPDYKCLTFDEGRRLAIKPMGTASEELRVSGKEGVTLVTDAQGGKKVHLEVRLQPGFTSDDVTVRVDQKQLVVSGQLHRDAGTKKQFIESYEIPQTVDPMAVRVCVCDGVLVAEAPLVSSTTGS